MEAHIPLILKYLAAGVLFFTATWMRYSERLDAGIYGAIILGCLAALGINVAQ